MKQFKMFSSDENITLQPCALTSNVYTGSLFLLKNFYSDAEKSVLDPKQPIFSGCRELGYIAYKWFSMGFIDICGYLTFRELKFTIIWEVNQRKNLKRQATIEFFINDSIWLLPPIYKRQKPLTPVQAIKITMVLPKYPVMGLTGGSACNGTQHQA